MADAPADPRDIALAALTNLIRLMGAELVAGRHRDDVDLLERAIRAKAADVTIVGVPVSVAEAGLAMAKSHVERALAQIRKRAGEAHVADPDEAASPDLMGASEPPKLVLQ